MSQQSDAPPNCTRRIDRTSKQEKTAPRRDSHPVSTAALRKFDLEAEAKASPSSPLRSLKRKAFPSGVDYIEDPLSGRSDRSATVKKRKIAQAARRIPGTLASSSSSSSSSSSRQTQLQGSPFPPSASSPSPYPSPPTRKTPQSLPRAHTPEPSSGLRLDYTASGPRYYQTQVPPLPTSSPPSPPIMHRREARPLSLLAAEMNPPPPLPPVHERAPEVSLALRTRRPQPEVGLHFAWSVYNPQ